MRRCEAELGVLATLLVSFLTIPLPLPHVLTATVWVALSCLHVARRRRIYLTLLHRWDRHRRRAAATTMLIGCAAVVTVSGFAQWAGVAAAIPWHAGSSTLLIVLAATHAARRLWRARHRHTSVVTTKSGRWLSLRSDRAEVTAHSSAWSYEMESGRTAPRRSPLTRW
jgi:hypothetical protein